MVEVTANRPGCAFLGDAMYIRAMQARRFSLHFHTCRREETQRTHWHLSSV